MMEYKITNTVYIYKKENCSDKPRLRKQKAAPPEATTETEIHSKQEY